ncbi:hypothetical protein V466_30935 [Pseudomonas mandelii PD30]|uniref:Uncharacterized protein n=1 Tax=Pseudomonas mandelii PD30 TaxID=1419583 RepID=A0A059KU04_9PSED|nr:hypothetical protein V466_30935 [Pseudomonas mandelii PD30]
MVCFWVDCRLWRMAAIDQKRSLETDTGNVAMLLLKG